MKSIAHLLALMKKGDDRLQRPRLRSPSMRYITPTWPPTSQGTHSRSMAGLLTPRRCKQVLRIFPDIHVPTPYPIQLGSGDWITVVTHATGTFTGDMVLPDGKVIASTGKGFDVEFGQTTKWDGDRLIIISAFWDAVLQARQIGLSQ